VEGPASLSEALAAGHDTFGAAAKPLFARRASLNAAAVLEEQAAAAAVAARSAAAAALPPLPRRPSVAQPADALPPPPAAGAASGAASLPPQRKARERELKDVFAALGEDNEVLNERAVSVMRRMAAKLTGRDGAQPGLAALPGGGEAAPDNVEAQVERLVAQAMSHENLCQSYIGWCPFW
jgi:hypothetical protein